MEAWLTAHKLVAVARPQAPVSEAPREDAPPAESRRPRSSDWMRQRLTDVIEGFSARDLDKVLAFAEFVKARRSARGYAARSEGSSAGVAEESPSGDSGDSGDDGEPESSRKVSAAR
jgi:hypothetical protein